MVNQHVNDMERPSLCSSFPSGTLADFHLFLYVQPRLIAAPTVLTFHMPHGRRKEEAKGGEGQPHVPRMVTTSHKLVKIPH